MPVVALRMWEFVWVSEAGGRGGGGGGVTTQVAAVTEGDGKSHEGRRSDQI